MSISPNVPTPQESYHYDGTVGTPRWIAVVFVLLFIALGALGYVGYSAQSRIEASLANRKIKTDYSRRSSIKPIPASPTSRDTSTSPNRKCI